MTAEITAERLSTNVTTIPALNREFVPNHFCHPVSGTYAVVEFIILCQ